MRNPNGYGSVVHLSGKRRKPYVVRKTVGWNDKGYPVYQIIGYCKTRKEGNILLAEYNKQPWDVDQMNITLGELYDMWCRNKLPTYSESSRGVYKSYYKHIKQYADIKYRDIRYTHMLDSVNKLDTYSKINCAITIWRKMDEYAYELDIITKKYSDSLKNAPKEIADRKPFTPEQIHYLFEVDDEMSRLTLVYIYTGMRASELLEVDEIDMDHIVGGKKTNAGKHRFIPIHKAIRPIIALYIDRGYIYKGGYRKLNREWSDWMALHGMEGKVLHECRHTFETELDSAGASRKCIDLLMGHVSLDVGNKIYNHKTKAELVQAINLLPDYSSRKNVVKFSRTANE